MTQQDIFAVYNTGAALIRWKTRSDEKLRAMLQLIIQTSRPVRGLLLGDSMDTAVGVLESSSGKHRHLTLDESYEDLHFIPYDANGNMLLRILSTPELREDVRQLLTADIQSALKYEFIDCDWQDAEGNPVLLGFDFGLCRNKKFCTVLTLRSFKGLILCFGFQADAFTQYCPTVVSLKTIDTQKFKIRFSI